MTTSKPAIAALIAAALAGTPAGADPTADLERTIAAGNQLGEQLVTCGAFFTISSIGFLKRGTPKDIAAAEQIKQQAKDSMQLAQLICNVIKQKPEVLAARLEMSIRKLRKEMADNFINFSILLNKYHKSCVKLIEDPERTIANWLK